MSGPSWFQFQDLEKDGDVIRARLPLREDNPWFNGHFPGQALLPGVALLALVGEALRRAYGSAVNLQLERISKVRFLEVVRPPSFLKLRMECRQEGGSLEASFTIEQDECAYARGRMHFRRGGPVS